MNRGRHRKPSGFTLVELAVVLAVISVMVAVVAPDFIEVARNDLAEAAAQEIVHLQDAAKWHYHNSYASVGLGGDPRNATWPGQGSPAVCGTSDAAIRNCLTGITAGCTRLIPNSSLQNPWGNNYVFRIDNASCNLVVATYVPPTVVGVMEAYLPGGECVGGAAGIGAICTATGGAGPAGTAKCCSIVPRPGLEASLNAWNPEITSNQCEQSLGGIWTNGRCDLFTERTPTTCHWVTDSDCASSEVAVGNRIQCSGKYCSSPSIRTQCCQQQP